MNTRTRRGTAIVGPLLAACLWLLAALTPPPARSQAVDMDREAITEHLTSIFEAYKRQDRAAIERTHTVDWTGFLGQSQRILRGIGDYMDSAERSMEKTRLLEYEITDVEIQLYGDIALVFYTALIDVEDKASGTVLAVPLRSLDIYRRDPGGWNQAGSHIGVVPDADAPSPWATEERN